MPAMADPVRTYTRLPGRRWSPVARGSLWLGPDHVLVVHETMTGESYRRFFFRDIKAIVIRGTDRHTKINVVFLVLGALSLLPLLMLASPDAGDRETAWLALGAVVWAALALINTLRGPTCETHIRTEVQDDVVPPLGRRRTAGRVADLLRPRILAAQSPVAAGRAAEAPPPASGGAQTTPDGGATS